MAKAKKEPAIKSKKSLRKEVANTLTEVFSDIKEAVGDKKFGKKVKKASKLLTAGALKKKATKAKPAKKAAEKAKAPKAKAVKPAKKTEKAASKKVKKTKTSKQAGTTAPAAATEAGS